MVSDASPRGTVNLVGLIPAYRVATDPIGEGPAVIAELAYSASGCFDGWALAKAGMAMQVT